MIADGELERRDERAGRLGDDAAQKGEMVAPKMPKKFMSPPKAPVCCGAMSVQIVQNGIT